MSAYEAETGGAPGMSSRRLDDYAPTGAGPVRQVSWFQPEPGGDGMSVCNSDELARHDPTSAAASDIAQPAFHLGG